MSSVAKEVPGETTGEKDQKSHGHKVVCKTVVSMGGPHQEHEASDKTACGVPAPEDPILHPELVEKPKKTACGVPAPEDPIVHPELVEKPKKASCGVPAPEDPIVHPELVEKPKKTACGVPAPEDPIVHPELAVKASKPTPESVEKPLQDLVKKMSGQTEVEVHMQSLVASDSLPPQLPLLAQPKLSEVYMTGPTASMTELLFAGTDPNVPIPMVRAPSAQVLSDEAAHEKVSK